MAVPSRRLRLRGHGSGLRLRAPGGWAGDPLGGVAECCRAVTALEKALGEAIREARRAGHSWAEVGQTLGATETAVGLDDVADAFAANKRATWVRFWT